MRKDRYLRGCTVAPSEHLSLPLALRCLGTEKTHLQLRGGTGSGILRGQPGFPDQEDILEEEEK